MKRHEPQKSCISSKTFFFPADNRLQRERLWLILIILCLAHGSVWCQTPPPRPPTEDRPTSESVATSSSAPADDGLIDLNLKNANIERVIQFISETTGKPVVKKKTVAAEITIATPGRIKPDDALDLIYDALLLEGFAVMEAEDRIQIIPVDDVKSQDIITITDEVPENLLNIKSRVIRKVFTLDHAKAGEVKPYIEPLLGKYASVTADERTNIIIIVDTVRNILRYDLILKALDVADAESVQVKVVAVRYGDASQVAEILEDFAQSLNGVPSNGRGQQRGQPQQQQQNPNQKQQKQIIIAIIPDKRTNSIVMAAPADVLKQIMDLFTQLDQPKPKEIDIRTIHVEFADAEDLADQISNLFRNVTGKSLKDTIQIMATRQDNNLVILSSEENFQMIKSVVVSLDTKDAQKRETRQFQLEHLDATDFAQELENLYSSLNTQNRYSYYSYNSRNRSNDSISIVPITRSNSIIVLAPPSEFVLIESLIKEMDLPVDTDEILPKIYYIENAKAEDVEEVLNTIFKGEDDSNRMPSWYYYEYSSSPDKSGVGRLSGKVKFSSDQNTNSIIAITNNKNNYEIVDKLIEQLDTVRDLANTQVYPLAHAKAKDLTNALNSLFGKPQAPRQQNQGGEDQEPMPFSYWWGQTKQDEETAISSLIGQVRIVEDGRTNSLLVTSASHHFPAITKVIEELDRPEPQVLIRTRVLEVQRGGMKQLGLRWSPDSGIFQQEDMDNAIKVINGLGISRDFEKTVSSMVPGVEGSRSQVFNNKGVISGDVNIDLIMQLLIKNMDAKIRIQPDLYMSNNKEGRIFVGDDVPRLKDSNQNSLGNWTYSYDYQPVGVTMAITPHINKKGIVFMEVTLETSQLTGESRFGSDIIQKRNYNTEVAITSGQTMVMGGIRLSTKQEIIRKFPVLGSIPLLGRLFQNKDYEDKTTDMYAFITAEVVFSQEEAEAVYQRTKNSVEDFKDMMTEDETAAPVRSEDESED